MSTVSGHLPVLRADSSGIGAGRVGGSDASKPAGVVRVQEQRSSKEEEKETPAALRDKLIGGE